MKGVRHDKLAGYLDERMWRDRYANTTKDAYSNILRHIQLIYIFSTSPLPSLIPSPTPSPISSTIPSHIPSPLPLNHDDKLLTINYFKRMFINGQRILNSDEVIYTKFRNICMNDT